MENIYRYSNYQDYLSTVTKSFLSPAQRPFSLAQWAKKLGYKSPRIIGMVLKGQRSPSAEMVKAWAKTLGLDHKQRRYFELLVQIEKKKRHDKPIANLLKELENLSLPKMSKIILDGKAFSYVADWFHIVLKQLVSNENGIPNIPWLYKKLRCKVSQTDIKRGIQNLIELNLIGEKEFDTTNDIPSEAIRLHHQQMILRAQEALEEQPVEAREITAVTFCIDLKNISMAKEAIREFREEFEARFTSKKSKEVYQFNMQFFAHTDPNLKGE